MKSSKNTKENSQNPKIDQFFKPANKTFNINQKVKESSKQYYVDVLKDTLQGLVNEENTVIDEGHAGNDSCQDSSQVCDSNTNINAESVAVNRICHECERKAEIIKQNELNYKEELQLKETKYKELQKRFLKLNVEFGDISLKYKDLLHLGREALPDAEEEDESLHDNVFLKEEIKALKALPLNKRSDSTFILQSLKFAYKSDLAVLCNKSVGGTYDKVLMLEDGIEKEFLGKRPLTPEKVERIRQYTQFLDRYGNIPYIQVGL